MEKEKSATFIDYLDQRTAAVQEDVLRLIADSRKDEADFEKIRGNIYQMVKTVFQSYTRVPREESECASFLGARLALSQETWEGYLAKAREHEDDLKILQEQTKLEALAEIQDAFKKIWG